MIKTNVIETPISFDKKLITFYPTLVEPPVRYLGADDLNKDKHTRDRLVNYFYLKTCDKWLYNDFDSLMDYFEVKNKKVKLIDSVSSKSSGVKKEHQQLILHFIESVLLSKKFIKKTLKEYVETADVNWYDLYYHSKAIKDLIIHRLKKKIIKLIHQLN